MQLSSCHVARRAIIGLSSRRLSRPLLGFNISAFVIFAFHSAISPDKAESRSAFALPRFRIIYLIISLLTRGPHRAMGAISGLACAIGLTRRAIHLASRASRGRADDFLSRLLLAFGRSRPRCAGTQHHHWRRRRPTTPRRGKERCDLRRPTDAMIIFAFICRA